MTGGEWAHGIAVAGAGAAAVAAALAAGRTPRLVRVPRVPAALAAAFPWTCWVHAQPSRLLALPAAGAAAGVVLGLLAGGLGSGLLGVGLGALAGWFLNQREEAALQRRFCKQLPALATRLADGMRAGLSLPDALAAAAHDAAQPLAAVLGTIQNAYALGRTLPQALRDAQARVRLRDFALICEALVLCHERGGPLPVVLGRVAGSIEALGRLREKLLSAAAGAVLGMKVMVATPFVALLFLGLADPQGVGLLFSTVPGIVLLVVAGVLVFVAVRWSRAILRQYL